MSLRHLAAALAAFATTAAFADTEPALAVPARQQIPAILSLDSNRAQTVDGILAGAQARLNMVRSQIGAPADDAARVALLRALLAIRYETDLQLATVLTPDEFARLKESLYPSGWERGIPRGTRM